jgi:ribosomal protein S18 acetylase RimI-like enzyme
VAGLLFVRGDGIVPMHVRELDSIDELEDATLAHHRAFEAAYDGILPRSVIDRITQRPTDSQLKERYQTITNQPGCYLLGVDDETILGYAWYRWGDATKEFVGEDEAGLKEIYLDPDHWRRGLGSALLDAGIDRLPETVSALLLEVLAENDVGSAFYGAQGFESVDRYVETVDGEAIEHEVLRLTLD